MFGMKKRTQPNLEDLLVSIKSLQAPASPQKILYVDDNEPRPCYARGKKAIFHRWANTANPITPRGVDPSDERARFFQYRATQAIVEYEDGTVDRVWPQDVRFVDGGRFKDYNWPTVEELEARANGDY